jgi:hypothetical protein
MRCAISSNFVSGRCSCRDVDNAQMKALVLSLALPHWLCFFVTVLMDQPSILQHLRRCCCAQWLISVLLRFFAAEDTAVSAALDGDTGHGS